jgi:redox-sensitive bicupin YhaK (pirin superfamily)
VQLLIYELLERIFIILKQGSEIVQPVPEEYNVFAYVINGNGTFGKNNRVSVERSDGVFFNDRSPHFTPSHIS